VSYRRVKGLLFFTRDRLSVGGEVGFLQFEN
jgi:hypothetical protein